MVISSLPGYVCSQRFHYSDDLNRRTTAVGLRLDMRIWIKEKTGKLPRYRLAGSNVVFEFETRGMAALFQLHWIDADQVHNDPPVDRALIDQI